MVGPDERRQFHRVSIQLTAELSFSGGEHLCGRVRDVSMRGVFVALDAPAAVSAERCEVVLTFGEPTMPLLVRGLGRVVRQQPEGLGVQLLELELDDFHHLYQLLRYNAPDPERIDAEFYAHVGWKGR